jgi:hypothetical protein
MSDPLSAPAFNLYNVQPTDIGSRNPADIEQPRIAGKVPVAPGIAADAKRNVTGAASLAGLAKAILDVPQLVEVFFHYEALKRLAIS